MSEDCSCTVLVEFKEHSRPILFNGNEDEGLRRAVNEVFSNEWNRYIDISPGQAVPDKSLIRVVLSQESKQYKTLNGKKTEPAPEKSLLPAPPPTEEEMEMKKRQEFIAARQFPRGDLLLLDKLGEGKYGPIYRGEAYGLGVKGQSRPVTVKMLAQQGTEETQTMFYQDIEMLSEINHLNIVGVLALCTEDSPECILLDAGLPGDLLTYVQDKKQDTSPLIITIKENLELLKIADEVSLGMAYLAFEGFIHKDLALRNCIIGYDGVVKIAHFDLGPLMYPQAYYRVRGTDLPIRWMSPETITSANFTTSSDIWAYGVLLWELFMYGELPFQDKTNDEVISYIVKDFGKLSKPPKCSDEVFGIMQRCWDLDPFARPTFVELHEQIFELSGQQQSETYHPSSPIKDTQLKLQLKESGELGLARNDLSCETLNGEKTEPAPEKSLLPAPLPTEEEMELKKCQEFIAARQFPRGDLLLLNKLGEGEYGPIYRGEAYGLGVKGQSRPVTVKMLAQQGSEETKVMFYQDIEMLSEMNHLNIVGALALCTEDSPECILLDAGLPGDLLTYVQDKKRDTSPLITTEKENLELLKIADEVSLGMAYVVSEGFIHKDLALRNCIIGYDGVVKIAHFGLGPLMYPEAYYRVRDIDLPVRWMPPETITSVNFTTSSDIWAYGVLLWELFMYGELPFQDKTNDEVISYIVKDFGKLSKPPKCSDEVFGIMQRCWDLDPFARPTFVELHEQIFELSGQQQSEAYHPSSPSSPMGKPEYGMDLRSDFHAS